MLVLPNIFNICQSSENTGSACTCRLGLYGSWTTFTDRSVFTWVLWVLQHQDPQFLGTLNSGKYKIFCYVQFVKSRPIVLQQTLTNLLLLTSDRRSKYGKTKMRAHPGEGPTAPEPAVVLMRRCSQTASYK